MAAVLKPKRPVLMPERFGLAEEKRRDFVANVENTVAPEDIVDPAFWSHLAPEMGALDTIEVRPDDGAWIAHLRVLYAERNYAKVKMERFFQIDKETEPVPVSLNHSVEWKGPHHRFAVIRKSDGEILRAEFQKREEANAWLIEYEAAR